MFPWKQKKEHVMNKAPLIVDELTRIAERADIFRHARDEFFQGISLAEMHCIHWIGLTDQPNVTKIAEQMRMTRGAISKIVKKLINFTNNVSSILIFQSDQCVIKTYF